MLWLALGIGVGLLNALSIVRTARGLQPGASDPGAALVMRGMVLRLALLALALALALRQGPVPGLLVFAGEMIVRWGLAFAQMKSPREEKGPTD